MRKMFIITVLLVAIVLCHSMVQAYSFNLIGSNFEIAGSLGWNLGEGSMDQGYSQYSMYSNNPLTPIAYSLTLRDAYSMSRASYQSVYMSAQRSQSSETYESYLIGASAYASTSLVFQPLFNGPGGTITFTEQEGNDSWSHHQGTSIKLSDTTTNTLLFALYSGQLFSNDQWSYLYPTPDERLVVPFTYASWDADHQYQLVMKSTTQELNNATELGYGEVTINLSFNNVANASAVPLPTTLLLFGPGLAGLVLLRRRLMK